MSRPLDESGLKESAIDEFEPVPDALYPYTLPLALLVLEPFLAWSLGLCHWVSGRPMDILSLLIRLGGFVAVIHVLLVGPIIQFAYPEIARLRTRPIRIFALCLLILPPLLSFGYYVGDVKRESTFFELVWDLFPLVLSVVVIYEKTRRLALLSLGLSLVAYFRFFIVGGILGPFNPFFQWVPTGDSLNLYRVVYGILILGLAFSLRDRERTTNMVAGLETRERGVYFLFMMAVGLAFQFGLPFLVSHPENPTRLFSQWGESLYLFFPICLLLSLNRSTQAQKLYSLTLYLALFAYAYAFTSRALTGDSPDSAGLWNSAWLGFQGMGLLTLMFACFSRRNFQEKRQAGLPLGTNITRHSSF